MLIYFVYNFILNQIMKLNKSQETNYWAILSKDWKYII